MPRIRKAKDTPKRRGNNEGSVFWREDIKRFVGQVIVGYKDNGKPIYKTKSSKNKQVCAEWVTLMTAEVIKKGYVKQPSISVQPEQPLEQNFETLFRKWYNRYQAPSLADVTIEKHHSMMLKHIFPAFGKENVKDVGDEQLQDFFNRKKKENVKGRAGYSLDFMGKMKNLLHNFFKYAVKKGYVATNPVTDVVIKKGVENGNAVKKRRAFTPEMRKKVVGAVNENPILKPILITALHTSLRPQELITLKWRNINFETKYLSVETALNRVADFDEDWNVVKRGVVDGKTKTVGSVRDIQMTGTVMTALREWAAYCEQNNIQSDFVFPNTKTGGMRTYAGLRSLFRRFMSKHGIQEGTLYTLRHTCNTMLLEKGVDIFLRLKITGQVKEDTNLLYCHDVSDTLFDGAVQALENAHAEYAQDKNSEKQ